MAKNKKNVANDTAPVNSAAANGDLDEETIMKNRAKMFARMNKKPKAAAAEQ